MKKPIDKSDAKDVVYEYDGYADGAPVCDIAHCPNCDYEFEEGLEPWGRNYCPECGQRIRWEQEE